MCVYKTEDGKCTKFSDGETTSYCVEEPCEYEKLSNYDRIKAMSVEEMAEFLMDWFMKCMLGKAPTSVKDWLLQEVSENDNG